MGAKEWGILVVLSLLWGSSFFFNGVAVKELPTLTVVVARVFFGALILFTVMRAMGLKMPTEWRIWRALLTVGFINNAVPFCLIVWGQSHIASGLASILNATTPLFAAVVAHYFTGDEKITPGRVVGVVIGIAGVAIMIGGDALRSLGVNVLAQLAVLGAAFCYAVGSVYARRFRNMNISPMATAAGQVMASSAMLVPVMLVVDRPWTLPMPSLATIGALIGVAALSTALAYILYFRVLATAGATNLLLVTFLIPVSAIMLGIFILDETLYPKQVFGMLMIALGLSVIDGRVWTFLRRQTLKAGRA
jgi:drug/metabolite transporter (DMT)-like permease